MRLLDLYCGAGGAALGYHRAGFDEIVGVDIATQPRYPFEFVQADALEFLADHGHEFAAIHASPPCQGYSIMHNLPWLRGREYPLLILPTIEMLEVLGKPYVVENVMGARHGVATLRKRGLESHGLKAGWLAVRGDVRPAVLPAPSVRDKLAMAGAKPSETPDGDTARPYVEGPCQPGDLPRVTWARQWWSYPADTDQWAERCSGQRGRHRPRQGLAPCSRGDGHRLDAARGADPGHPASLHGIHRSATAPDSRG